jgi:hypothetical protein
MRQSISPPASLRLTWAKHAMATRTLDALHVQLLIQQLAHAAPAAHDHRTLAQYAAYTQYVEMLAHHLEALSGGMTPDPYDAGLEGALTQQAHQEIATDVAPLVTQWTALLAP